MNNYGIPQNAIITIAGTVGVGKSTLTQALADKLLLKRLLKMSNIILNININFIAILNDGVSILKILLLS
ncbi:hypothetical protein ACVQ9Z_03090 [Staphylococcus aureus]